MHCKHMERPATTQKYAPAADWWPGVVTSPETSPGMPEDTALLAVYVRIDKAFAWTMLGLFLTVTSVLVLGVWPGTNITNDTFGFVVLIVAVLLFGAATTQGVIRLLSRGPVLVVNRTGIVLTSTILGQIVLPWSEIEALRVYRSPVQAIMNIVLFDTRPLLARHTPAQSLLLLIVQSRLRNSGTLIVGDSMLGVPMPRLLQLIQERFAHELKENHIQVISPKR